MDLNGDGEVTQEEAAKFFKSFVRALGHRPKSSSHRRRDAHTFVALWRQGKVSAKAMFNEVDGDGDKSLTIIEWDGFWGNVLASGYTPEYVLEELETLEKGEAWVDFDDGRTT